MKRLLSPSTNMPGLISAVGVIAAVVFGVLNSRHGQPIAQANTILPSIFAALSWISRQYTTPIADPKDGNGQPLVPSRPGPAAALAATLTGPRPVEVSGPVPTQPTTGATP